VDLKKAYWTIKLDIPDFQLVTVKDGVVYRVERTPYGLAAAPKGLSVLIMKFGVTVGSFYDDIILSGDSTENIELATSHPQFKLGVWGLLLSSDKTQEICHKFFFFFFSF